MLEAGFAEVDITPELGLGLAGVPDGPLASGIESPLFGRVALFDDGGQSRVAIVTLDLLAVEAETVEMIRSAMSATGKLDPNNILISCTHTHNAPQTKFSQGEAPDVAYLNLVASRLSTAVQAARAALEPVSLTVGRSNAPGMTLNRRPMYAGGEVASCGPVDVDEFVRLEGPADDEVQLLQAVREDGSVAGGLVSFSCHPLMVGLSGLYSSDYHGALVRRLAEQHKAIFLSVQGAEGNLQPPLWGDPRVKEAYERGDLLAVAQRLRDEYVEGLLAVSEQARAASSPVCGVPVRSTSEVIEIDQRSPTREQVDLAYWYLRQDPETVDPDEFNRRMTGHAYTHWGNPYQEWFAREAIGMWWAHRGATHVPPAQVEIQVIALGDIAFVAYPAEVFCEFGLRTKDESPFPRTIVCGLANGAFGYVPTSEAFSHGGYETRMAYTSRLVPSAGDQMTETALRLLNTVAQTT